MLHICVDFRWFGAVDELSGRSGPDHVKPSSRSFKISTDHSTPWSSRGHHYFTTSLEPEVECLHPITWQSLNHITRPRGRVSSPSLPEHYSTWKSSITITTTRLHTRWQASEPSSFRTQPDTRAQGRKEDFSYSLDHMGRVQFLIRPNTFSF